MYIASISIKNYKCFWIQEPIALSPNFTVIVGMNNAGKTAFLEAVSKKFTNQPHKSIENYPYENSRAVNQESQVTYQIHVSKSDIEDIVFLYDWKSFYLRIDPENSSTTNFSEFGRKLQQDKLPKLIVTRKGSSAVNAYFSLTNSIPPETFGIRITTTNNALIYDGTSHVGENIETESKLFAHQRVYIFNAQRHSINKCIITPKDQTLKPDASNLPSVIHNLRNNKNRFERYLDAVKSVFPEISWIHTTLLENNEVEIIIRGNEIDPKSERSDLNVKLENSGTGLSQVLAILFVVITSTKSTTIIIDEPQTYLHPSAVRKLFNIFKQYHEHQYIITTHSPIVINVANPEKLLLINKEKGKSRVVEINKDDREKMHYAFRKTGISLSDIYGADHILWVEGKTEEKCYPLIIDNKLLLGTVIKSIINTGDFRQKKKKIIDLIFSIYAELTEGVGLMSPSYGFILDGDWRQSDKDRVLGEASRTGHNFVFTEYKNYESYLLHPEALAFILNENSDYNFSSSDIELALQKILWQEKDNEKVWNKEIFYLGKAPNTLDYTYDTRKMILGSEVLKKLFDEVVGSKLPYEKVDFAVALTEWILLNDPSWLAELKQFLEDKIIAWSKITA